MYVFLDLDTTGLDPDRDSILQIAMQVTDDALEPIGGPFVSDVALTERAAGRLYMNPYVRDMHRKTGLLDRLERTARHGVVPEHDRRPGDNGPREIVQAEACAVHHIRAVPVPDHQALTIAGNSVHFDLAFLRVHMPRLARMFSHRIMDVSVLRMFEAKHGAGKIDVDNANEHDALADVQWYVGRAALRELVERAFAAAADHGHPDGK